MMVFRRQQKPEYTEGDSSEKKMSEGPEPNKVQDLRGAGGGDDGVLKANRARAYHWALWKMFILWRPWREIPWGTKATQHDWGQGQDLGMKMVLTGNLLSKWSEQHPSWSYHPQSTLAHSYIPSIEGQLQGKLLENLLEKMT